ncbi:unnamed protein product [Trichobilharzia regenti]|nr:unnamed protein product [Trichobilharzia regenti]
MRWPGWKESPTITKLWEQRNKTRTSQSPINKYAGESEERWIGHSLAEEAGRWVTSPARQAITRVEPVRKGSGEWDVGVRVTWRRPCEEELEEYGVTNMDGVEKYCRGKTEASGDVQLKPHIPPGTKGNNNTNRHKSSAKFRSPKIFSMGGPTRYALIIVCFCVFVSTDRLEHYTASHTTKAYYTPNRNRIHIHAGLLNPPYYSHGKEDSVIYGGLGWVIAHELLHAVDTTVTQSCVYDICIARSNKTIYTQSVDGAIF